MVVRSIDYKKFVCTGSVMQSSYWAAVKHGTGWKPYAFEVEDGERQFSLLVLVKQVLPFWQLAYIPFAPEQSSQTGELLKQLAKALRKKLPSSVFALRYDLPFDEVNDQNVMLYNGPRFRTCRESVQPEGTVRIDLHWGYQAVTKGYRDRAKRALRKASQVFEVGLWGGDGASFKRWYEIYLETAKRDGFSPRSEKYIKALLSLDGKVAGDVECKLLLAAEKRKIVGGIIVLFFPNSRLSISTGFPALRLSLLCSCVAGLCNQDACEKGCAIYDLYGIPGPREGKPFGGLEVFKLSFGGQAYIASINRLCPMHSYLGKSMLFRSTSDII